MSLHIEEGRIEKQIALKAPRARVWSDGTLLTVTESGFQKLPPERRAEAFRMNEGGWAEQLQNIERHVAT
jgi:hypothetical protein